MEILSRIGVGLMVFASTNVDDIFLLAAFFADPHLRPMNIVAGQLLGIGALVALSSALAVAAVAIPERWTAFLGLIPLALGLRLIGRARTAESDESAAIRNEERTVERRTSSQIIAVASVTAANGGDNLGVYIPVFANDRTAIPAFALIFAAMTAVWCWLGYRTVNHPVIGRSLRQFGYVLLPVVLIAVGLYILSDAL